MSKSSNPTRVRLMRVFAAIALVIGVGLLLLMSADAWWYAFFVEGYENPAGYGFFTAVLLLCVALVEWPWRRPGVRMAAVGLRLIVVTITIVWLWWCLRTNAWLRWAIDPASTVTEYFGRPIHTQRMQGIHTLLRIARLYLFEAGLPVLVLIWFATVPGLRTAYELLTATHAHNAPDQSILQAKE